MKRTFTGLFMLMAGSLLVVQMASANSIAGKLGLFGNLGYSMYAMEQANEQVDLQNEFYGLLYGLEDDAIGKITGGLTIDGGIMYGLLPNLLIGLELGYLTASSTTEVEMSDTFMGLPMSISIKTESSAPALTVGPIVKCAMPIGGKLLLTGGLGLDYASVAGKVKMDATSEFMGITTTITDEETASGSGIGFKILVGGEMFVTPMVSVGADLGYRILKITELKDGDGDVIEVADADGNVENMEIEYSGLIIKGGVKLYF